MRKGVGQLSVKLEYEFKNPELLEAALTHRSVRGNNNERLEFLGDAIVNFIIADALFTRYPRAKEGELSRLRATLVKGETLAALAQTFDLGKYLHLGVGEIKSGGAKRESILADAMEAVIAAIYIDSGFLPCRERVLKWYEGLLDKISPSKNLKDPKTNLQEYLQSHKLPLPTYTIQLVEGEAHAQLFCIQCQVKGIPHKTFGKGKSRRKAEQDAAEQFLNLIHHE